MRGDNGKAAAPCVGRQAEDRGATFKSTSNPFTNVLLALRVRGGHRLAVHDDVLELEIGDAGSVEIWLFKGNVEVFEGDVTDRGLVGCRADRAK